MVLIYKQVLISCLGLHAASEVIAPIALDKASDLLPVSEASFEELRVANAALRASNADLKQANNNQVAVLEAAEDKIRELTPVSFTLLLCASLCQACIPLNSPEAKPACY